MAKLTYFKATQNEVRDFFPFFTHSIQDLFPEYTVMTREYFVKKDYTKLWLEKVINKGDKVLFIAKDGDAFAGYLLVNKVYGGVSTASWLAVTPQYQKQGVATKLVTIWEDYCLKQHAHALQLWTTSRNLAFYTRRGFINAGTFEQAWFGVDMPLMYKNLRPAEEKNYLHKYLAGKT